MHALRHSALLIRLVLAWFVLAIGVAGASPAVQPKAMELICTTGGAVTMVMVDVDGQSAPASQHTLDCSLCLNALAPVTWPIVLPPSDQPLAHALTPMAAAHIAALVGAPLPPRGPPQLG